MRKKITFLIVIYKTELSDSNTILSILKSLHLLHDLTVQIKIWDNSPYPQPNNTIEWLHNMVEPHGVIADYINTPENIPLSKVYNTFFDECKSSCDYLVLLDQDSFFAEKFIELLFDCIKNNNYSLILPSIRYKGKIVSPSKAFFMKGFYFDKQPLGVLHGVNISAINSGMCISSDYLRRRNFKYDERLGNYCTDDFFMREYCRNSEDIYVLDYTFEHELSLSTLNNSSDELKKRYALMLAGKKIVYSESWIKKMMVGVYCFFHRIYMVLKYKDLDYF